MEARFRILGSTRLRIGDHFDDQWGPPKLRGILAVLLLHPRRPIPIETLIDWVWPEGKAPRGPAAFYTYIKRIRDVLARMPASPTIICRAGAYRIEVDREEIDFFEFQAAADQARSLVRSGEHEQAARTIAPALDMWRDVPLADPQGERASNWRLWAQAEHMIPAYEILLQALTATGRFDEVLHRLANLPIEHQTNLTLIKRRLEALHGLERYNEATTYFLSMRKQMTSNFDQDEADELLRFYKELELRSRAQRDEPLAATDPADAAPLAPHLLPHDISDFTGREDLLGQLDAMTTTATGELISGVVVLNGPPGVGKTSLAVHWAHRVAARFPGGVLHADLNGFSGDATTEPTEVIDRFLVALGYPVERIPTTAGRAAKLRNLLAGRRVLSVLDNARGADQVLPLLDCLSTCLVVVTSRHRLGRLTRRGALSLAVPPLSYRQAKTWLAHRVGKRAVNEPDEMAELAAICRGSPLTLRVVAEHAAARQLVRLREFVEELRDGRTLLGLGDDGDSQDGSLRTVFSWSYDALSPDERRMFRLLGLHPGPDVSLDVAAALVGQDGKAAKRCLDALVDAHLISQPESRDRYRFHDLLRDYAAECAMAEGFREERVAAERRMLDFYLHTANHADTIIFPYRQGVDLPPPAAGVRLPEFVDVDAAMNWCIRERANLNSITQYSNRHGWHGHATKLPVTTGEIFLRFGYYEDVVAALSVAIMSARATGDLESEADALSNLGFVQLNLQAFTAAESQLMAAKERYDKVGYRVGGAVVTHHLARIHLERGELKRGIDLQLTAVATLRSVGDPGFQVIALHQLASAYRRAHDLAAAISYCRDALWIAEKVGDNRGSALILAELGNINRDLGELPTAKGYLERALAIHERIRDLAQAGKASTVLALIHRDEGDLQAAERWARRGLQSCRAVRDARGEAAAQDALAQVLQAQARHDEAIAAYQAALAILVDLGDPHAPAVRARLAELTTMTPDVPESRTERLIAKRPSGR